jgi:hypothetical protein
MEWTPPARPLPTPPIDLRFPIESIDRVYCLIGHRWSRQTMATDGTSKTGFVEVYLPVPG